MRIEILSTLKILLDAATTLCAIQAIHLAESQPSWAWVDGVGGALLFFALRLVVARARGSVGASMAGVGVLTAGASASFVLLVSGAHGWALALALAATATGLASVLRPRRGPGVPETERVAHPVPQNGSIQSKTMAATATPSKPGLAPPPAPTATRPVMLIRRRRPPRCSTLRSHRPK